MPVEACTTVTALHPDACRRCGGELEADASPPTRHQVWELPEITPIIDEYQLHRGHCACCGITTQAELPEGAPSGLKRQIGSDVIVVDAGRTPSEQVVTALRDVPDLGTIETSGNEVLIAVSNGAAAISPVAVALSEAQVRVEGLTLRTPTLDDVFLHMTGARLQEDAA